MKIKDLDHLLELLPTLRRLRTINADMLRVLLGRENGECTWCGGELKGRQRCWCSAECVHQFRLRTDNAYQIDYVRKRESDKCQRCGRNVAEAKATWDKRIKSHGAPAKDQLKRELALLGHGRGKWWEVDHAIPVCEGGGLCSIENLRLLCGKCHQEVTSQLTKRNSTRKRKAKRPTWIRRDCSKCDGFFMEVKGFKDNTVTLTCQQCGHLEYMSAATFDATIGGAQ